jgi:hypothetical protein
VLNNPIRYNDPTGHRACDDYDSAGRCITAPGGGGSGFGGIHPKNQDDDNTEDLIGLGLESDLACTISSCSIEPIPGICPIGDTCWLVPTNWDLDPMHADYQGLVINAYFGVVQIVTDRYGNEFLSVGGSTSIGGISWIWGSIGNPFDEKIPDQVESKNFLTGLALNVTGSELGGVGYTLSPWTVIKNVIQNQNAVTSAWEGGIHVTYPSVTLTGSWGFPLP